jgi:hypothetical protein
MANMLACFAARFQTERRPDIVQLCSPALRAAVRDDAVGGGSAPKNSGHSAADPVGAIDAGQLLES